MDYDLPEAHFGAVGAPPSDWRKVKTDPIADDDDDEQLAKTPPDVVEMLGFDPLDDE